MKKNTIAAAIVLLMMSAALAAASYEAFDCTNGNPQADSGHDFSCGGGPNPQVWCVYDQFIKNKFLTSDCAPKCAKACGQMNTCHMVVAQTCEQCCGNPASAQSNCDGKGYAAYSWTGCFFPTGLSNIEGCACQQACMGTCQTNKDFCNIIALLYMVVGIGAAVMIAINGLLWIKSEDAHSRNSAKNGIWYVIVGLIVIVAASAIVGFLLGRTIVCI